jgi:hypothetical protein
MEKLERQEDTWDGLKRYAVMRGDTLLGYVQQHKPTFEHKSKGRMYVNSRWTAKRPRWIYEFAKRDVQHNPYRYWVETRAEAIASLASK